MKKTTGILIGLAVIIVAGTLAYTGGSKKSAYPAPTGGMTGSTSASKETTNPNAQGGSTSATSSSASTYTMADVAKHNSQASCWTTISGGVYDVTSWINQHPGGPEAILSLCGADGSAAFNGQHGGQRRPEQELASFKIGTLSQ